MSSIRRSALVPYSAQQMFDLVTDIESYPEFLPWCGQTRILSQDHDEVVASIEIAYHGIRKTFTTRNRLQAGKLMEMRLVEGPFKHLHGFWTFHPLDAGSSKISVDLEFDFSSKVLELTSTPVLATVANRTLDGFCKRAAALYGEH